MQLVPKKSLLKLCFIFRRTGPVNLKLRAFGFNIVWILRVFQFFYLCLKSIIVDLWSSNTRTNAVGIEIMLQLK